MLITWIIIEEVGYGNAESAAPWRHREKAMPGSAGPDGDTGRCRAGHHAAGTFRTRERTYGGFGRDVDTVVEGVRVDVCDKAELSLGI